MPAPYQRHLAIIIEAIKKASQPSQLDRVKNLQATKLPTVSGWANIVLDFIMNTKRLNWYGYSTEKKFIDTFPEPFLTDWVC